MFLIIFFQESSPQTLSRALLINNLGDCKPLPLSLSLFSYPPLRPIIAATYVSLCVW